MKYRTFSFPIPHRGRIVNGTLLLPDAGSPAPAVIFSHGYNGSADDFAPVAEVLAERGIASYCFDFCGGSVHAQDTLSTADMTIGTQIQDLEAALDRLKEHERIRKDAIFLFGGSQGGLVSALVAAERSADVAGLALLFPALCIADNWRERYPAETDIPDETELWGMKLGRKFFLDIRTLDPFSRIGSYGGRVLLLHGDEDDVVPLSYSQRAEKVYPNVELVVYRGEKHGFTDSAMRDVSERLLEWMERVLAPAES